MVLPRPWRVGWVSGFEELVDGDRDPPLPIQTTLLEVADRVIGGRFGCFGRKSMALTALVFYHLPGPSIFPKGHLWS